MMKSLVLVCALAAGLSAADLDAFLPKAFARRNARTGAPVVALLVQGVATAAIIVLGQGGANLKAAYDFLVAMSVLSYTLPFLILFAINLFVVHVFAVYFNETLKLQYFSLSGQVRIIG